MNAISECLMKPGTVVSLNGDWGSGKTHCWYNDDKPENTIRQNLEKSGKKTIYISLFGKSCISDLKKEILNKSIEIKGTLFHFLMSFILIFFLTALISVFALQIINSPIVKFVACVIAGITTGLFYSHILRFFAQKALGFDHNNIDFSTILNSEKIVFCFDDLERLSKNANLEEFMGFFESLSRQGFSMLLIQNSNYRTDVHSEIWKEFKEKVVKVSLQHKKDNIIHIILNDRELTDFEKFFINSLYVSLQNANTVLDTYVESERDNIHKLASNFRFYKKLMVAFGQVKKATQNYKDLDKNTIGNMLMYVTVICVHNELEIPLENPPTKEKLYDFLFGTEFLPDNRHQLKHLGMALRFEQWYGLVEFPQIYNLLRYGEFDYKVFTESHATTNGSELERFVLKLEQLLEYRTCEMWALIKKIDYLATAEDTVFTSLERLKGVLDKYAVLCGFLEIDLEKNPVSWLQREIEKFIKSHKVSTELFSDAMIKEIILSSIPGEDKLVTKNKKSINSIFEQTLLNYWIRQIAENVEIENEILPILQDEHIYFRQLFLYVFINDVNMYTKVFDLRDVNYQKWQEIMQFIKARLKDYDENYGFVQHIRSLLNDTRNSKELFHSAMVTNIKELENMPGAGLSEQYTVRNLTS